MHDLTKQPTVGRTAGRSDMPAADLPNNPTLEPSIDTAHHQVHLPPSRNYSRLYQKFHQHTSSESTNATESYNSSPTTIYSVVDDSSATEPSPGSSPESPPPTTFAVGMLRPRTADDSRSPFFELQKPAPPKKGRNLKNLAVSTGRPPLRLSSTTGAVPSVNATSNLDAGSILSPSFVKPPTPPRRKINNLGLTIMTPAANGHPGTQEMKLAIPATPAFNKPGTLRHFQSSPSLPLVKTLGLNIAAAKEYRRPNPLDTLFSPLATTQPLTLSLEEHEDEEEPNYDIPQSKEEKPDPYPHGPLNIYAPNIDLYLEPTADEAMKYDVIMNVASEVRNPFEKYDEPDPTKDQLRIDGGGGIQLAPRRDHLKVDVEEPRYDASTTTPTATSLHDSFPSNIPPEKPTHRPEYVHIKWEHNSDIVPDLLRLVKLIDDRATAGKRVLVHCQCGVSRSASLLVAYGLYQNPALSVQDAYNAVKKKSKWIGPNMNLIMQLQEFRSSLARGGILSPDRTLSPTSPRSAASEWNGPFSEQRSPPLTAAVSSTKDATSGEDTAALHGPSSAPLGNPWLASEPDLTSPVTAKNLIQTTSTYIDPAGHVVPMLNIIPTDSPAVETSPGDVTMSDDVKFDTPRATVVCASTPQSAAFSMTPVLPTADANPHDDFGILSPTSTEFSTSPWDRSALLASLGMGTMAKDEETPRRSLQLPSRPSPAQVRNLEAGHEASTNRLPVRKLRPRISSPTLREQQRLHSMQAEIEASLPTRAVPASSLGIVDEALMSPRATEFTNNPFALTFDSVTQPEVDKAPALDPRSPAQKGSSPIVRNIMDFF